MTQAIGITSPIILQRVVPETNTRRQYTVLVGRDLFGTPVVVCRWGRIGQAGQMRTYVCAGIDAAEALAADVVARRRRSGYSSGDESARQPSKERARRPSVGQMRRRVSAAKAQAPTAQLPLFDAETLRPAWLDSWQRRLSPATQRTVKMLQIDSDAALAAPSLASAPVVVPLMQRLGKPATFYEREQWIEKLIADPRMQGQLRRRRDYGRP